MPALAHLCALRGVKAPAPGADYAADAAGRLADLAGGRLTPSRVDRAFAAPAKPWDDDAAPEWLVTLGVDPLEDEKGSSGTTSKADGLDGDDEVDTADATAESPVSVVSVNETLVAEGLCRADRQKLVSSSAFAKRLFAAQERARADRAGMWEYGDVDSDDDDTSVAKPGAWGRRR